ncbi:hypothetical protein COCMIDRAFT_9778 [Bipolaris oryzae ATCC 44560]|uniref:Uncharacterized protein n=1 Tax=Bipolaris oryzae ATCC 44560 TaxID=930090 RepID=W6Z9H2_COCMI|nr:uncharacterized protein COCMIDRAFT_9778 [Bipolaris oryzae ATCC 44560]EUC40326.1 hypothetical protein COCMIDRAFT_9778 [Bipolaris oryzae ATCC 44560]
MASQNVTSYTAVPRRNSDSRFSFEDIPSETQSGGHQGYGHPHARGSISDEDDSHPHANKPTSTAQAVPLTTDHQSNEDTVQPVEWKISLYTPISMVALFISGVAVAVGHHLFYLRFDNSPVRGADEDYTSQVWIIRYGTAFAFVTKTLLAGAIIVAYKQHMWINLRHEANSVSTIDAVFAATHDLLSFLHPSFWARAKIPALMALIAWCLPLAALIPPSTLTVTGAQLYSERSTKVPTLNLNDTTLYQSDGIGEGTSPLLHRLTIATATSMQILPMRRTLPVNATYTYSFDAPSLKCTPAAGDQLQNFTAMRKESIRQVLIVADQRSSIDADMRYLSFAANASGPGNATTYVSKCVAGESFGDCGANSPIPTFFMQMGNETITCTTHNTNFTALFGDFGGQDTQPVTYLSHEFKEPLNTDVTRKMFRALSTILNGFFGTFVGGGAGGGYFSGKAMIPDTALLELLQQNFPELRDVVPQEAWMSQRSNTTLAAMIEELSRNQTLSLFGNERLWETDEAKKAEVAVRYFSYYNMYEYSPRNLWVAYGAAIVCSFAAVLLGLRALWVNGVCHDNSFSAVVAATRSRYLDRLTRGHSLGATPMGEKILRAKLRFGVLEPEDEVAAKGMCRAGFGTEDSVMTLKKGQTVY